MTKARSISAPFILFILAAAPLAAREAPSYPYGYVSHVAGEITLQRATEAEPSAGALNVPVMPGDRLWTPSRSRAEIAFADGTRVRLDESTKLDVVEAEAELLLRVWSGSVIVLIEDDAVPVRIDTPSGSVFPEGAGLYRVDLTGSRLALSVTRGSAELATSESSVIVHAGETSETVSGSPTRPYPFNTARLDAFDRYSESLDAGYRARTDVVIESLPREVHYSARELHHHGEWYSEPDYGWVWYPSVAASWAPYRHGRWHYTRFGYTWISYEPWGWAPYHYGRWGYGHRGWYWIPGAHWSPAWVSFAFGPTWVGWSPLGFHGRAVFGFDSVFYPNKRHHYRGGKAVPRHVFDDGAGWNFAGRQQFTAGSSRARLRASQVQASAGSARLYDSGAVLDRDLRPHERSTGAAGTSAVAVTRPSRAIERRLSGDAVSAGRQNARTERFGRRDEAARQSRTGRTRSSTLGTTATATATTATPTARSRYGSRETQQTEVSRADRSAWRERASSGSTTIDRRNRGTSTGANPATSTREQGRARARAPSRDRGDTSSTLEPFRPSGSAWRERAGSADSPATGRAGVRDRGRSRSSTTRGRGSEVSSPRSTSRPSSSGAFERSRGQSSRPSVGARSRDGASASASAGRTRGPASSAVGRPSRSVRRPAATAGAAASRGSSGAATARRRKN